MNIPHKHYKVGGCVRDFVLDKPIADIDYVVIGATPEDMLKLNFKQVGADFPVFLHPETGDEYALARTERKNGRGYNGFVVNADPTVTLEEDLARRDFTMNAMAMDNNGFIIDPYNGLTDIVNGVMRHVSDAFADDPVRVLRGARFAARYDFKIAPETTVLMKYLVDTGELDHLTKERIIAEFDKGFTTKTPSRMFEVLNEIDALTHLYPQWKNIISENVWKMMNTNIDTDSKWAILLYTSFDNKDEMTKIARDYKLSSEALSRSLLLLKIKEVNFNNPTSEEKVSIWTEMDFRRKSEQALEVLKLKNIVENTNINVDYWKHLSSVIRSISEEDIIKSSKKGEDFKQKIKNARIAMCDLSDRNYDYTPG